MQRQDFGLADLFGASYAGGIEGPMQNSYLAIEHDPFSHVFHPLLAGLEDAGRIINGVKRVKVETTTPLPYAPLTLVPSYPDLPMEMVWPRVNQTDIPEVYMHQVGEGRVVYFPWDIDRSFWEVLCVDHGKLLTNAVDWATNEERPVTVTGQGVLDVTVWQQQNSMTVHLVNLTDPMMMKGPIRELIAVGEQVVRLQVPEEKQITHVHLLRAGITPDVQYERGAITVRVPPCLTTRSSPSISLDSYRREHAPLYSVSHRLDDPDRLCHLGDQLHHHPIAPRRLSHQLCGRNYGARRVD